MITLIKKEKFKIDKTLGYKYVYLPDHELANAAGKVYEHIYFVCFDKQEPIPDGMVVHHIDRDRTNNTLDNLIVLSNEEHAKLHQTEDNGSIYLSSKCPVCDTEIEYTVSTERTYCSNNCKSMARTKFDISKEDLEELVWQYPTTKVAEKLGVSDVAVAKRCKKLGITKPPRGYWRKFETGKV